MTTGTNTPTARRSFLAFLTGVAAAPVAAVAATPSSAPAVIEAPELLELGRSLDGLVEAYRVAVARKAEAAAIWERTRPEVPDALIESPSDRISRLCDFVHDADGGAVGTRQRYTVKDLRLHLIRHDISGRSKEGRRLHRLLRLAKIYEGGIAEAYRVSNYEECAWNVQVAAGEASRLAGALLKMEPATVDGLLICARLTSIISETVELGASRFTLLAALGEHSAKAAIRILPARAV